MAFQLYPVFMALMPVYMGNKSWLIVVELWWQVKNYQQDGAINAIKAL